MTAENVVTIVVPVVGAATGFVGALAAALAIKTTDRQARRSRRHEIRSRSVASLCGASMRTSVAAAAPYDTEGARMEKTTNVLGEIGAAAAEVRVAWHGTGITDLAEQLADAHTKAASTSQQVRAAALVDAKALRDQLVAVAGDHLGADM